MRGATRGSKHSGRNFEWQLCAAKGQLPGQGSSTIRFAFAPRHLKATNGWRSIGGCEGYAPAGCGTTKGYASSDVFFLEACVFSLVCANRESMWAVGAETDWTCELEWDGFETLRNLLLNRGAY